MHSQCVADAGNDTTICVGSSVVLGGNPTAIDASVGVTYLWTSTETVSDNTAANPTALLTNTGVYSFSVTLSSGGCDGQSDIMLVNVVNPPVANFTFSPDNACASVPVTFTNTSSGCTNCSFEWNFGDGTPVSMLEHPTHAFLSAVGSGSESFTVELTTFENGGCSSSQSFDVTVQQIPEISLTDPVTDFTNCIGEPSFSLSVTEAFAPTNVAQFNIDWGDGTADWTSASAPGNEPHTYTGNDIWNLEYSATGNNGCTATHMYEVTNISSPAISVASPGGTQGCAPLSICFPLSSFSINHTSTIYVVDYGDATPFDTLIHPPPDEICHVYDNSHCPVNPAGYTFKITAVNNCSETIGTVFPIRIYISPQAAFDGDSDSACVNSTLNFTNNSIAGYNNTCSQATTYTWNFGDGSPDVVVPNTNAQSHTYNLPGNYTVSLTASNGCGNTTDLHGVCIQPPLTASFTIDNSSGCVPLVVSTSNTTDVNQSCAESIEWLVDYSLLPCSPAEGIYSFAGSTNANSLEPQFSLETGGTFDLTLRVTNACGITEQTETVTVNSPPTVEVFTPSSICINTATTATAVADGCNLPIDSYLWTFPGGVPAFANTLIPPEVTYSAAGNYTATLTVTNACGSTNDTGLMPVFPAPDVQISSSDADLNVCSGSNTTLTATGAASYSWSPEDYLNTTSGNEVISSPTAPVTYTVTGISGSCSDSETITLNITSSPTISSVEPFYEKCEGENVQLEVVAAGGSGVYDSYQWQPDSFLSDNAVPNPICSATVSTTYQAFVIDSNGCIAFTEVPVFVNPNPIVNAGPDIILCNTPVPEQLIGVPAGGSWTGPFITSSGVFTPSGIGSFVVTYSYSDSDSGCSADDASTITVLNPSQANAGSDVIACFNEGLLQLTGFSPAAGGVWSGPGVVDGILGTIEPEEAGVGLHVLTFEFGSGSCLSSDDIILEVLTLPAVSAGPGASVCEDTPTFVLEGFSPTTGGIWEGFGIVDPQIGSFNPVVGAGDYEVFYRIEDLTTGCADTAYTTVNVLPLPNASFVIPPQACSLVPIDIQNLSSGASTYNWDFGNSNTSADSDPVYSYPASDEGQNTISLTVTSVDGCTDFLSQNVEVVNAPVALFGTNLQSGCSPLEITFENLSSGTDNSYTWDFGNDTGSTLESPDPVIYTSEDQTGFFDISLFAQNLCGDDDTTITITVFPNNSEAYFDEGVSEICLNLHIGLALNLDEPENFEWSVSVFSENANVLVDAPLEVHSNSDEYFNQPPGNYQLVISTSYEGCSDSSEGIPVNFSYCSEANVFLPKCFTPNGDGTNDLLTPVIWGIEENSYEFIVTNRERNVVFRSTTVGEGWDGTTPNDNLEAQIGVYFYQVLYVPSDPTAACAAVKDGKCEKLGHVTIVR